MVDVEEPPIRIRGNPTPEEIAAIIAVLLPLMNTATDTAPPQAAPWRRPPWELDAPDRTARSGASWSGPAPARTIAAEPHRPDTGPPCGRPGSRSITTIETNGSIDRIIPAFDLDPIEAGER